MWGFGVLILALLPYVFSSQANEFRVLAETAFAKGELSASLALYTKLIEGMNDRARNEFSGKCLIQPHFFFPSSLFPVIAVEKTQLNFVKRAKVLLAKQELDKSLADLQEALTLDPTYVQAFLLRAQIYKMQGEMARAVEDLEKVLKIRPNQKAAQAEV